MVSFFWASRIGCAHFFISAKDVVFSASGYLQDYQNLVDHFCTVLVRSWHGYKHAFCCALKVTCKTWKVFLKRGGTKVLVSLSESA